AEPTIANLVVCLILATLAGGLMSLVHAYVSINLKADQVISGTAINLITPAVALFLVNHFNGTYELLLKTGFPRQEIIGKFTIYPTIIIAIILVVVTYYVIYKRPFGLRLRSVGENP
ncbi:ABC transporter permease, partial [Streptococcus danieliae]|nr:ABC transporter permease [Streptococcus danieliae]